MKSLISRAIAWIFPSAKHTASLFQNGLYKKAEIFPKNLYG